MTDFVRVWIEGTPVAKLRHRQIRVRTKSGDTTQVGYTPAKTKVWERQVAWQAQAMRGSAEWPWEGPVKLHASFVMPVPKSWSRKAQAEALGRPHTKAPDLDNLMKAIQDALNGIAYVDDRQICAMEGVKRYGKVPGVEVALWKVHPREPGERPEVDGEGRKLVAVALEALFGEEGGRGAALEAVVELPNGNEPVEEGRERIVAAAVKRKGAVTALAPPARHGSVIAVAKGSGQARMGFITSRGRFVDRKSAWTVAVKAGQVDPSKTGHTVNSPPQALVSEDLW